MKKLMSFLLAVLLLSSLALPAMADATYDDVAEASWYAGAVGYVTEKGLMAGTGNGMFSPDGLITRATAVTVLYRLAGEPAVSEDTGFADVQPGMWYTKAISWAARAGIASGYDYGYFGVNDPMTRQQLATVFWRYTGSPDVAAGEDFADESDIASYADKAVDWARAGGVIVGKPGNLFDPNGTATRAQLAQILMNYIEGGFVRSAPAFLSELDVMAAPCGILRTEGGILLVTDTYNKVVWQVRDGVASVYVGGESYADEYGTPQGGYLDGTLDETLFALPWAITPFLDGWAVSDAANGALRLVRLSGTETINAQTDEDLAANELGVVFAYPTGLATDDRGDLYVSDTHNGAIRKITSEGTLVTVISGLEDPMGLAWHDGALYIAETGANRILKVRNGAASVVAGGGDAGYLDGDAASALFSAPQGLTVTADGVIYVADTANGAVRRIKDGAVATVIAASDAEKDSVPVSPIGLLVQGDTLYICDNFSRKVITVTLG